MSIGWKRLKYLLLGGLALSLGMIGCWSPPPVDEGQNPPLYNVLASKWKGETGGVGSHEYRGRWFLFDQVVISPGMLDGQGWECDLDSGAIITKEADRKGRPLPFDHPSKSIPPQARGASDHFPVTVRLRVEGGPHSGYLFCFWNVENFFDDTNDGIKTRTDKPYDKAFGANPQLFQAKVGHLRRVLLGLNGGKGPDILALAEVENENAAEKLRVALNDKLDRSLHYGPAVIKLHAGGRRFGCAVLSRLKVVRNKAQLLDKRRRILEVPIEAHGHALHLVVSHWTSRVSDKTGEGRKKYANKIHGRIRGRYLQDPAVDYLVCGDFNDNPTDESVRKTLHAITDRRRVRSAANERLVRKDLERGLTPE